MTEAYLTMNDMIEIRSLMQNLTQNYKTSRYALEVMITDRGKNIPVGMVKQVSKGSEFVFVPAAGYVPYAPTDKGE